jgi:CHAD domain-containing protein
MGQTAGVAGRQEEGVTASRRWWHGPAKASPRTLSRRFADSLGLVAQPPAVVERRYFDTFDWRLFARAEVLADEVVAPGDAVLVLQDRSGHRADLVAASSGDPRRVADLPTAIRRRVYEALAPRALLEVGQERAGVWTLKQLDDDAKTTAFVDVERVTLHGAGPLLRVQLRPVRGYERDARRLAKALDEQADLRPGTDPLVLAAQAAGREPSTTPKVPELPLDPKGPGGPVLAAVFDHLLAAAIALEDGVRRQLDPEFLHDFRITVRRTRSALRLARPYVPEDIVTLWAPEWAWLASATSAPRDLDVLVDDLDAHLATIDPELKEGMIDLIARLAARRDGVNAALATTLAGERYGTLKRGWRVAVTDMRTKPDAKAARARAMSAAIVAKGAAQVLEHARALDAASPAEDVHALRKRVKRARYVLELFGPLLPKKDVKGIGRDMSRLQDALGTFQDVDVQRQIVARLVAKNPSMPAETMRAAEHLLAVYGAQQADARASLGDAVARATSGGAGRRLEHLAARS